MTNSTKKASRGFSSQLTLIISLIAASVGTGNIWRFPRVAAANGGGAFIIAYIVIMLLIVIPVMMGEHVIGRATRHGLPGAIRDFAGRKGTWMGSVLSTISIMANAYYAVVLAWVLYYLGLSVTKGYFGQDKAALFDSVSNGNVITFILFLVIIISSAFCAYKGVKFLEKLNKIFIPLLFVCLVITAVRTVTLPNATVGLNYLFSFNAADLLNGTVWLEALMQAVWSAGVGSGLGMAVTAFSKRKSDLALTSTINGLGDMFAAMLAGIAVVPAVFAFYPSVEEAVAVCQSGNNGLTFLSMTNIFESMPGGQIIAILFFTSLLVAGYSSEITQHLIVNLPLVDAGKDRKKSTICTTLIMIVIGAPSAFSSNFLSNQDWVAGMMMTLGVLVSCYALMKFGLRKIREKFINNPYTAMRVGKWWEISVMVLAPVSIIIIFVVNMVMSVSWDPNWWNPFGVANIGTFVVQGGLISIICFICNNKIADGVKHKYFNGEEFPDVPDNGYSL